MYSQLSHKADLKYIIESNTLNELFADITFAVNHSIFHNDSKEYDTKLSIKIKYNDIKMAIHDYIEELIYIAHYKYKQFVLLELIIKDNTFIFDLGLRSALKDDYYVEVKACSYNIDFKQDNGKFETVFTLDI